MPPIPLLDGHVAAMCAEGAILRTLIGCRCLDLAHPLANPRLAADAEFSEVCGHTVSRLGFEVWECASQNFAQHSLVEDRQPRDNESNSLTNAAGGLSGGHIAFFHRQQSFEIRLLGKSTEVVNRKIAFGSVHFDRPRLLP